LREGLEREWESWDIRRKGRDDSEGERKREIKSVSLCVRYGHIETKRHTKR
jgi:hypothetical protein